MTGLFAKKYVRLYLASRPWGLPPNEEEGPEQTTQRHSNH